MHRSRPSSDSDIEDTVDEVEASQTPSRPRKLVDNSRTRRHLAANPPPAPLVIEQYVPPGVVWSDDEDDDDDDDDDTYHGSGSERSTDEDIDANGSEDEASVDEDSDDEDMEEVPIPVLDDEPAINTAAQESGDPHPNKSGSGQDDAMGTQREAEEDADVGGEAAGAGDEEHREDMGTGDGSENGHDGADGNDTGSDGEGKDDEEVEEDADKQAEDGEDESRDDDHDMESDEDDSRPEDDSSSSIKTEGDTSGELRLHHSDNSHSSAIGDPPLRLCYTPSIPPGKSRKVKLKRGGIVFRTVPTTKKVFSGRNCEKPCREASSSGAKARKRQRDAVSAVKKHYKQRQKEKAKLPRRPPTPAVRAAALSLDDDLTQEMKKLAVGVPSSSIAAFEPSSRPSSSAAADESPAGPSSSSAAFEPMAGPSLTSKQKGKQKATEAEYEAQLAEAREQTVHKEVHGLRDALYVVAAEDSAHASSLSLSGSHLLSSPRSQPARPPTPKPSSISLTSQPADEQVETAAPGAPCPVPSSASTLSTLILQPTIPSAAVSSTLSEDTPRPSTSPSGQHTPPRPASPLATESTPPVTQVQPTRTTTLVRPPIDTSSTRTRDPRTLETDGRLKHNKEWLAKHGISEALVPLPNDSSSTEPAEPRMPQTDLSLRDHPSQKSVAVPTNAVPVQQTRSQPTVAIVPPLVHPTVPAVAHTPAPAADNDMHEEATQTVWTTSPPQPAPQLCTPEPTQQLSAQGPAQQLPAPEPAVTPVADTVMEEEGLPVSVQTRPTFVVQSPIVMDSSLVPQPQEGMDVDPGAPTRWNSLQGMEVDESGPPHAVLAFTTDAATVDTSTQSSTSGMELEPDASHLAQATSADQLAQEQPVFVAATTADFAIPDAAVVDATDGDNATPPVSTTSGGPAKIPDPTTPIPSAVELPTHQTWDITDPDEGRREPFGETPVSPEVSEPDDNAPNEVDGEPLPEVVHSDPAIPNSAPNVAPVEVAQDIPPQATLSPLFLLHDELPVLPCLTWPVIRDYATQEYEALWSNNPLDPSGCANLRLGVRDVSGDHYQGGNVDQPNERSPYTDNTAGLGLSAESTYRSYPSQSAPTASPSSLTVDDAREIPSPALTFTGTSREPTESPQTPVSDAPLAPEYLSESVAPDPKLSSVPMVDERTAPSMCSHQ